MPDLSPSKIQMNAAVVVELDRGNPQFEDHLDIALQHTGNGASTVSALTVRIIQGFRAHGSSHHERLFHIEIADDNDHMFLFGMDIGEHDFHVLKKDQSILVEFPVFPTKLIELFKLCQENTAHANSTFSAKLDTSTGVFSIIEVNPFKQIVHIALQLRPGNDSVIKNYLAARLQLTLNRCSDFEAELVALKDNHNKEIASKNDLMNELTELRHLKEVETKEIRCNFSEELAKIQRQSMESVEEMKAKYESQIESLRETLESTKKDYSQKQQTYEQKLLELHHSLEEASFQSRDQQRQAQQLQREKDRLEHETEEVTQRLLRCEESRMKAEREATLLSAKLDAMGIHIKDKDEALSHLTSLHQSSEARCGTLEQQLSQLGSQATQLRQQLLRGGQELAKGNQVIAAYQKEVRSMKDRCEKKDAVIRKQEQSIQEQGAKVQSLESEMLSAKAEISASRLDITDLRRQLDDARGQIAKNEEIIDSNNKVITYLNEEQNKWQLGIIASQSYANGPHIGSAPSFQSPSNHQAMPTTRFVANVTPDGSPETAMTSKQSSAHSGKSLSHILNDVDQVLQLAGVPVSAKNASDMNQDWRSWDPTISGVNGNNGNNNQGIKEIYKKGLQNLGLGNILHDMNNTAHDDVDLESLGFYSTQLKSHNTFHRVSPI